MFCAVLSGFWNGVGHGSNRRWRRVESRANLSPPKFPFTGNSTGKSARFQATCESDFSGCPQITLTRCRPSGMGQPFSMDRDSPSMIPSTNGSSVTPVCWMGRSAGSLKAWGLERFPGKCVPVKSESSRRLLVGRVDSGDAGLDIHQTGNRGGAGARGVSRSARGAGMQIRAALR